MLKTCLQDGTLHFCQKSTLKRSIQSVWICSWTLCASHVSKIRFRNLLSFSLEFLSKFRPWMHMTSARGLLDSSVPLFSLSSVRIENWTGNTRICSVDLSINFLSTFRLEDYFGSWRMGKGPSLLRKTLQLLNLTFPHFSFVPLADSGRGPYE